MLSGVKGPVKSAGGLLKFAEFQPDLTKRERNLGGRRPLLPGERLYPCFQQTQRGIQMAERFTVSLLVNSIQASAQTPGQRCLLLIAQNILPGQFGGVNGGKRPIVLFKSRSKCPVDLALALHGYLLHQNLLDDALAKREERHASKPFITFCQGIVQEVLVE